jgi:type IV pilus assembly protein PilA
MFSKVRNDEGGFTLVELLVVILIVGLLAAIALPVFLGQRDKAYDAEAKSDARNMVSHVESCFADTQDYSQCAANDGALLGNTGLDYGTGSGQVSVTDSSTNGYTISAFSRSGKTWTMTKTASTGVLSGPTELTAPSGG